MARAHYYVLRRPSGWKVQLNGVDYSYTTKGEAVRAAVDAAHSSGRNGHDAQVLIQGSDGKWQTEWTYGNDPYPPPG